eukprot:TRINITY_DN3702_c0_g1_i2.p3 TRINITY_DN3702_c0_g1~~TRINITY_DN3702_c0_g1_i2.p3  ORF type:complete len:237 (+),score=63.17 TRINITY_DN3702_c0_g1_i2:50-712(+)
MEAAALEAALAAAVRCARGFGRGFAEGFVRGGDAVLSYSRPCARAAAAVARAHAASLYWCVLHGVPFEERAPVVVHVPADEDEAKAMPPAVAAHFAGRSHVERVHAQLVATHAVEEQPVVRKAELPQRPYHAAVARFVCAWAAKGELPLVPLACAPMAADMLIEESTGECLRRLQECTPLVVEVARQWAGASDTGELAKQLLEALGPRGVLTILGIRHTK